MIEFTSGDRYLFNEGTHKQLYKKFGSFVVRDNEEVLGTYFCVYAPHASKVCVVGDFNHWNGTHHEMRRDDGIWSLFIPGIGEGSIYKYEIVTAFGQTILKADPYAFYAEQRPNTASIVYDIEGFEWTDAEWAKKRQFSNIFEEPLNIYELHLGSWRRNKELVESETFHSYTEIMDELIEYVLEHSYTHIELMPLYEHPFDGSWGYQATGYYAASSRYGEPKDLMMLINRCHEAGIGVIMDWVPGHFCRDAHGLFKFDGEAVYEYPYEDIAVSEWGTGNFDLGKGTVRSFLISNALFWMKYYHVDGFRVDAVANMIYWDGNKSRGVNHGAVEFIQKLNEAVFLEDDKILMIAEDSTSYPLVTAPVSVGGLGFSYKWNMGWI
ncbi:1,4-alpha-glucan branching enzyme, partial [Turicibacter sanguinis]|nr:1,4-alpha-glucan branching enzyme [Turicibacter sanguinis]